MIRIVIAAALVLSAATARADTLPLVVFPSTYVPGTPFNLEIHAPGLIGLSEYNIDFAVSGATPTPPDLSIALSTPADIATYPFPDTSGFHYAFGTGSTTSYLVNFNDTSSGAPANTVAGVNDHLASITITPGFGLTGPIRIQFTNAEFSVARDVTVDLPPMITIDQEAAPAPVPEPASVVLLGIGGVGLALRRRFLRAK